MTPPAANAPGLRRIVAVILVVGTFLLFARAIGHDFVNYDDPDYVTENPQVQAGLSLAGIRWALTAAEASNWHPLTWISHQADVALFGMNPRGHHATSVLWHALNAGLAFLALWRLTRALWPSAWVAAWFAWHPQRVESVAWVAERKDVLSGFFFFAVLWLYAGYVERRRERARRAWLWYGLALVAFALGLMAKPMLVTLPCVLLLLDVWPLRRTPLTLPPVAGGSKPAARTVAPPPPSSGDSWLGLVIEKVPYFGLVLISALVTYRVQQAGGSVSAALPLGDRVGNAIVSVVRYLWQFVLPFDLAVLYPHPGAWPARQVIAAGSVIAALSAVVLWQWRRRPWLAIGWCWYLGMLVPVSGLVQVGLQAMADRYTYLPMVGVALAVLWTATELAASSGARRTWAVAGVVVLGLGAVRTWQQLGVWRDSFTLFDHALAVTKGNYVAHDNRGYHLSKTGRLDEAIADYRRSLAINPAYMNANNNLGHALAEQGKPAEAIPHYRRALEAQPVNLEVRNNLANALSDLNQLAEAMEHYEFVLARRPDHVNALNGSGVVLAMQGKPADGKARLERALQLKPDNPSAHSNLGNVCHMLGDREAAIRHYRRATELNPREPFPFFLIGTLLNQQEKFAEAVPALKQAIALRPTNPDALTQLGLALARLGRIEEAVKAWRAALQQRPGDAQVQAWLQAVGAGARP
ncbi:MAG: tetratricopeptide repeat protein [Verrucomicrobia bacterium]|nr:tetratricopeptide repeat protein [Verrucomicrobiota bacterium]